MQCGDEPSLNMLGSVKKDFIFVLLLVINFITDGQKYPDFHAGITMSVCTGYFVRKAKSLVIRWIGGQAQFMCPLQFWVKASTPADAAEKNLELNRSAFRLSSLAKRSNVGRQVRLTMYENQWLVTYQSS